MRRRTNAYSRAIRQRLYACTIALSAMVLLPGCASRGRAASAEPPVAAAAQPPVERPQEATSLLGEPLYRPVPSEAARARFEAQLDSARRQVAADPADADALIWVGRRLAYLGRYNDAIDVFTQGIARHPRDARFLRHRGHRFITVRRFEQAIADFNAAAALVEGQPDEIEPDGLPNPRNIPTSTLQFNIWYHLGLAHYLRNDLERALAAYERCLAVSANPDALVATVHWTYMTLRRLGRDDDARRLLDRVHADMDIIENEGYHQLVLMYRGELEPDALWQATGADALEDVTIAYGVANWHLYNGRRDPGERMLRQIIARGQWPAFAHIAAEADLARLR